MRRAWGGRSPDERRRIVLAAMIFGEQFDRKLADQPVGQPAGTEQSDPQRLLMAVINASIDEFSRREDVGKEEAAELLGEVETRDLILEFDEVLEARQLNPERTLDELLREAVDNRVRKARWADHWTSG